MRLIGGCQVLPFELDLDIGIVYNALAPRSLTLMRLESITTCLTSQAMLTRTEATIASFTLSRKVCIVGVEEKVAHVSGSTDISKAANDGEKQQFKCNLNIFQSQLPFLAPFHSLSSALRTYHPKRCRYRTDAPN